MSASDYMAAERSFTRYFQELEEKFAGRNPEDFADDYAPPLPDNDEGPPQGATADRATAGGDGSPDVMRNWRELTPATADEVFNEIGEEILHTPIEIATATSKRENWNWVTPKVKFGELLARYFLEHKEGPKDGRCILQGSLSSGKRDNKNVTACYIVLQDFDNGDTMEEIASRVPPGTFCLLHHTHSHLKPESDYAEKAVLDWLEETGQGGGTLTVEQARAYMRAKTEVRKEIIDSVHSVEKKHVEGGVRFFIHHAPMHRVRAFYVIAKPFIFAERETSHAAAIEEWSERYLGFAAECGASIDAQCIDASRLMYTPRRPPGSDPSLYKIMVHSGAPLDFESVPRVASKKNKRRTTKTETRAFKTPNLAAFLKGHRDDFEAAEFVRAKSPESIGDGQGAKLNCTCPSSGHEDDQRFLVMNASDSEHGVFVMSCHHDTCSNENYETHLDDLCQTLGIADAMELREWCPRWEEEQHAQEKTRDELAERVAAVTKNTPDEDVNAILDALALLPEDDMRVHGLVRTLIENSKFNSAQITGALKARHQVNARTARNNASTRNAYGVPDDPSRTTVIWSQWDYSDKVRCAIASFNRKNGDKPEVFTRPEGGAFLIKEVKTRTRIELQFQERNDADAWGHHLNHVGIKFKSVGEDDDGRLVEKEGPPTRVVCARMRVSPDVVLPVCAQTLTTPVFNAKGELRLTEGYDPELCAYLKPNIECIPPPVTPTEEDVDIALEWLLEPVRDFPFTDNFGGDAEDLPMRSGEVDDDGHPLPNLARGRVSRVNFYALMLQPFVRAMINGPCPAFHIDKPEAGTGATKLVNVAALIFEGQQVDTQTLPKHDEELAKAVLAFLRTGGNVLFFDNINHHVDSGVLAGALTAGRYRGRILGLSAQASLDLTCSWVWAGNNVTFSHELMRRNVPIRLDAATPHPEKEPPPGGYKYDDLEGWVRQNRQALVWACHTLIQNWIAKGCPAGSAKMGSFEDWARVMSGILESAGVPEGVFLGTNDAYRAHKDDEAGEHSALVQWIANAPVTRLIRPWKASDLLQACEPDTFNNPLADLGITHPMTDEARRAALGNLLKALDGKTFKLADGRLVKLTRLGKDKNRKRYDLVPVVR